MLGDDRAQGLIARQADAPVILTGPQAAAGLVQRLHGPRNIETHDACDQPAAGLDPWDQLPIP